MSWRQGTLGMAFTVLGLFASVVSSESTELLGYEITNVGPSAGTATLWDVSPVTGVSNPRPTIGGLVDIEFGAGGTLFGLSQDTGAPPNSLFSINPVTGAATLIGPTGISNIFEGDLAFNPATGTLYALYQLATPNANLYTINMTTGAATLVGGFSIDFRDPSGMSFDGAGNLFVLNTQDGFTSLLQIDPATGAEISDIDLTDSGNPADLTGSAGMDFDPLTNTMYLTDTGTKVLYTLNTTTGELTFLLGGGSLLAGAAAGLTVVPEAQAVPGPATLLLLAAGMTVAGLARRGRPSC